MKKSNNQQQNVEPVPFDEAWWAAVLAEDESLKETPKNRTKPPGQQDSKSSTPHQNAKSPAVNWRHANVIYEHDEMICLQVVGYNRGGLLVEGNGLQGFVPVSHLLDLAPQTDEENDEDQILSSQMAAYVGRTLQLKVIECDPQRGRIVLSERAALAGPGQRNLLLNELQPGDHVRGTVTNITDFGVFVDLGGLEGLIHVSELSWGRVHHPGDAVSIGSEVEAYVIQVDKERSRVALSLKRLHPNPWETAEVRYHTGQVVDAMITSVVAYGAFARLEEGLDGLIHVTEMGIHDDKVSPQELFHEGQVVQVRVLHVDANHQRLGLSLVLL